MKNAYIRIWVIGATIAISLGLFSNALNARNTKSDTDIKKQIKEIFSKEYSGQDLLNILVNIENDILREDMDSLRSRSKEISDYLTYRRTEVAKHDKKYSNLDSPYKGERVLEIKYGKRFNSKELVLPLTVQSAPLRADLADNEMVFSSFRDNEISEVTIRYVTYDVGNRNTGIDLRKLSSSVGRGNIKLIREDISNVYEDILVDHSSKISLVTKIRDSLAVAKYLLSNNQARAAQSSIGTTDSLMLRLIEARYNSPSEQRKIRNLRKDLDDVSKVSDASYLSEWEKIPHEIEDWWNKK